MRKILVYLLKKLYGLDIRDLIREELNITTKILDLEKLEEDKPKYQLFLNDAHALASNKVLDVIVHNLTASVNTGTLHKARTIKQLMYGHLSLIILGEFKEEVQRLNSLWESSQKQTEIYDKHEGV